MVRLEATINVGLGDSLATRILLESVKNRFDEILISHNKEIVNLYRDNNLKYWEFLNELGPLVFSEKPYIFDHIEHLPLTQTRFLDLLVANYQSDIIVTPSLYHMCQGEPLNIGEYVVITTKVRVLSKHVLIPLINQLWETLNLIDSKYKIVILGEKEVESNKEYINQTETTYSIYNNIINGLNKDRIVDLTIPALGVTIPDMKQIKQDMLIMKNAKFVIVLGVGGNFCMSVGVANTINFRNDDEHPFTKLTNIINQPQYPNMFSTQNWNAFLNRIKECK